MPEDRFTISSTARLHPDEVARHTFGTTRRGFDPAEVRSFLEHVAREMMGAADREQELRKAVAEAEHRAANPVLDDATLTAALGQETARVLRTAHDAANELVARAENDAARLRAQAQEDAEQLQRHSEQSANDRAAQTDAAAAELRRRAEEEATARVEGAKLEAEELVTQARAECRSMVQEAQELRARVLADLTRRRRVLHSQIEQLRAGRERLAETIGGVRHAVDHIADELFRAEDEARLAAEAAGRQVAQEDPGEVAALTSAGAAAMAADQGGPASGDEEPERRQSVEELFARLRAEAGDLHPGGDQPATEPPPVEEARSGFAPGSDVRLPSAAPPAPEVPGVTVAPTGDIPGGAAGPGGNAPGGARTPAGDAGAQPPPPGPTGSEVPGAEGAADSGTAPDDSASDASDEPVDPVIARRDEVLTPLVATLARRLKRALQDDQNDILDRLRAKGGWAPTVLLSEDEHAQRYVRASVDQLVEVAHAGATFAGGKAAEATGVGDVAAQLAADIVGPLRRRLDGEGRAIEVGDDAALVELVGAAFREWKGARVERLAGDQAVFTFARAALAAMPDGATLRWVVDDDGAECPDCDDNALAGPVPAGEDFPTGHRHPPAHAGCRCLLAPANA